MTIAAADLRFYASTDGSSGIATPSLGGGPRSIAASGATAYNSASVVLSSNVNALFDIVTGEQSERSAGYTDYRIIYVANTAPGGGNAEAGSVSDEFSALNLRLYLDDGEHSAIEGGELVLENADDTNAGTFSIGMAGAKNSKRAKLVASGDTPPVPAESNFTAVAGNFPSADELINDAVSVGTGIKGWNDSSTETNNRLKYSNNITLNNSPDITATEGTGANGDWVEVYLKRTYTGDSSREPLADATVQLIAAFDRQAGDSST